MDVWTQKIDVRAKKERNPVFRFFLISAWLGVALLAACAPRGAYSAIEKGGEWFLNNQNEEFLFYQYLPATDTWPDKHHSAREFGALWSITRLAGFLDDSRYDDLALKGWKYFEATLEEDAVNDFYYFNVTPGKIKLSYNAFAILVLLELENLPYGEVEQADFYLKQLANGILYQQEESGELGTFFYSDRSTGKDYYPGQALLALMSLYEETEKGVYLNAVKKALPFYISYFSENPNTAFVPWQSQAYYKYYQSTHDSEAAHFVLNMNDFLLTSFQPDGMCKNYQFSDVGIVLAVYVEGMNKAYALADELNDEDRKKCYKNFIQEGSTTIMSLQFPTAEQNPDDFGKAAMGGFFASPSNISMQVDRNQHAVMALMGAYDLGLVKP